MQTVCTNDLSVQTMVGIPNRIKNIATFNNFKKEIKSYILLGEKIHFYEIYT